MKGVFVAGITEHTVFSAHSLPSIFIALSLLIVLWYVYDF